jgi:hypothetical protein
VLVSLSRNEGALSIIRLLTTMLSAVGPWAPLLSPRVRPAEPILRVLEVEVECRVSQKCLLTYKRRSDK